MNIKRIYEKPTTSILLFGPRGTGKSTFIKNELKPDLIIDLLKQSVFRQLSLNPSRLEELVAHLSPKSTVLIDEVQKIPEILDEVHRLIEEKKLNFYLTGSSARKLKKNEANMLAGRALSKKMYPLSLYEIKAQKNMTDIINFGSLPRVITEEDKDLANDYLFSYVETYLKEEVFQEGLVRNLNEFSKFIELAGRYHGQILNYENLARELAKSGDTIKAWFQILQDTLIGHMLEAYSLKLFEKETKHPKFYYFDCGVARAAEGISDVNEIQERKGYYFETIIINEIKVYLEVKKKKYKIYYYNISGVGDIDLIIETKKKSMSSPSQFVAIEIKLTQIWKSEFEKLILKIHEQMPQRMTKALGIYLGQQRLTKDHIEVLPLKKFVELLWGDQII